MSVDVVSVDIARGWYTAKELEALKLPGLPTVKRKINERALAERWAVKVDAAGLPLARPRAGQRGGGLEYAAALLPAAARTELARRSAAGGAFPTAANDATRAEGLWSWFDAQGQTVKAEAQRRLRVIDAVAGYEEARLTRSAAVACAAGQHEVATSTLWNWLALVDGVDAADRLAHLAPRRSGGGAEAAIDADAWQFIKSDFLRPEKPSWTSCYERMLAAHAIPRGLSVPHPRTLWRKLEREVDGRVIVVRREGADALRLTLPPQQRTVADLHAMELVNMDGHKFDVFVHLPSGKIGRPLMVAIQDIHSRKFVGWRIAETENAVSVRLTLADMFGKWGIPKGCVVDNGRGFASKWITGGAKTRYRFKVKDEEPLGVLTQLNVRTHWTIPFRGQSKPIERAFRDLCDTIAKHPALAGAYTGNRPDAKPENYGSKAIPWEAFKRIVDQGIHAHNARANRTTETARVLPIGERSFDQAFARSYVQAEIGKATPEQLRLALLTAEEIGTCRRSGAVTLMGNRYWSPEMSAVAGRKVTVRFDPDDLTRSLHVYDRAGRYLAEAPVLELTGFLDAGAAKARARQERELRKAVKHAANLENLLSAAELAEMMPVYEDEADAPAPTVIRPMRSRGHTAAALKPVLSAASRPSESLVIDRFAAAAEGRRLRLVQD